MENSSSTNFGFVTEYGNLLRSFDFFETINGATVKSGTEAETSSISSPSAPVPPLVGVPLYSQRMWAVHDSLSGRRNLGRPYETFRSSDFPSTSAVQENPFEHCTSDLDIFLLALSQQGSQYLQDKLASGDPGILEKLFWVVFEFTFGVMRDQYGCFFFGKFIESCSQYHLALIILKITLQDQLFLLALSDRLGSRSIKKLIRVAAQSPLIKRIMSALKRSFKFTMVTKPGSSVILQCLEPPYTHCNDYIYEAALEHCLYLACHEQGYNNINNFIDKMKGPRRKQILHLLSKNAACLSKNPSGNFVVQHILKIENSSCIDTICNELRGHYVDLSLTKCGSFVVQKCFQYQNTSHHIVEEFVNSDKILQVASDKYGNYVIQTALVETSKSPSTHQLHQRLIMKLRKHLTSLQMVKFGNSVYRWIRHHSISSGSNLKAREFFPV